MTPAELEAVAVETGVDVKTVRRVIAALPRNPRPEPELVLLRHAKLPDDQLIQVDRRRLGARLAAGWEEVKPEVPESEPKSEPALPEKPRQRRRNSEEQ